MGLLFALAGETHLSPLHCRVLAQFNRQKNNPCDRANIGDYCDDLAKVDLFYCYQLPRCRIRDSTAMTNGRFGSLAAPGKLISSGAAIACIPVARQRFFKSQNLNVCFHRKRPFGPRHFPHFKRHLTARSGT